MLNPYRFPWHVNSTLEVNFISQIKSLHKNNSHLDESVTNEVKVLSNNLGLDDVRGRAEFRSHP